MSSPMLDVRGLNAFYGKAQMLFDVTLNVGAGEVVALMGRNGAGKSTTIKSLMGLLQQAHGRVHFMGEDISGLAPFQIARRGLGFVPEDRRVFSELSVMQNLEVGRQPARPGLPPWTPERLFALFPNLGEMPDRPGGSMSGGEQQMLTVARTLMGNPLLLMLDEPSEGVAPVIVEQMAHMILQLKQQGLAILLSEQNLHFARLVCDRAYVLEQGQIRFSGSMQDLAANEEVQQAYLSL
jgi:branched-chain amino acid transport system ATP-binding protein